MATAAERLVVRTLTAGDGPAIVALAAESLEFHRKWIKLPTSPEEFQRYLAKFDDEHAFFFVLCDARTGPASTGSIVGFVSLTGIEREPYQRGRLGYGVFKPYARTGYLAAGLRQVIDYAFGTLGLHRLEADVQPANIPSKRLVEKLGFTCEGTSRGFIRINGEWADHERWALTAG